MGGKRCSMNRYKPKTELEEDKLLITMKKRISASANGMRMSWFHLQENLTYRLRNWKKSL